MIILFLFLFLFANEGNAKNAHPEKYYQELHCKSLSYGRTEVALKDGTRADCVTADYAIEYDFCEKWAECGTQALHYGAMLKLKPQCLLICNKKEYDKYSKRLENVAKYYNLPLDINWIEE